ncbi:MAG: methyltransferase domain-containing protein [Candidatus Thermoplasmatota archaeon]|jgi:tellurite methyltransferase|nr:methyltransferase domain-containing protein [Candidatus Thermoplasmatota archaeon]
MIGMHQTDHWDVLFRGIDAKEFYDRPLGPELDLVIGLLPEGASVLDLGCGMGRAAIALAEKGYGITAVDSSRVAIERLRAESGRRGLQMDIRMGDVRELELSEGYDLIIAHGILQFLPRSAWERLLLNVQEHTLIGGMDLVAVFTDKVPLPADTALLVGDVFREGELLELYEGWDIIRNESYVKEEVSPSGSVNRYPMDRLIAKRGCTYQTGEK